ncbi:uncharacterized protein LOC132313469 [Cornus florida]|uniref:uncharacterized protein LOC132313469 n=1 Tax=Cornus florida TaxID=4283 RepID=UPI002898FB8A|nr:uncharacterized protein LOC132313469 [Cornus florida]
MAILSLSLLKLPLLSPFTSTTSSPSSSSPKIYLPYLSLKHTSTLPYHSFCSSYRFSAGDSAAVDCSDVFEEAVALFNGRDYYRCHDYLEDLWNRSQEPVRTLVHGILQCAVGFHHLFNQNHKGAMMELGEGVCKLRKMNFESGPFHQFEREISAVLEFIYQTQLDLAACTDDFCLTLDQSERSYQLLGGYAAGQRLYRLESDPNEIMHIVFCPERSYGIADPLRVKLPVLHASQEHLKDFETEFM